MDLRNKLLVLLVLSYCCLCFKMVKAEVGDIMPFAGLSRTSSEIDLFGEKETVTGYEIGVEYEWIRENEMGSASRLGLKNINADSFSLLFSSEISMNILTIGQSVSYDFDIGGGKISAFGSIDIGAGLAKAEATVLGTSGESDSELVPYAATALGLKYYVGKWVPFLMGGYQYAKSDDLIIPNISITNSEVDFSGGFFTLGLGYML